MKTFFGGIFIEREKLEEAGINHPIKLEYYKQINEEDVNYYDKARYGIQIVKTEYLKDDVKVETKHIKYVTNDELEENNILNIFKDSQVTPVNCEEILSDLLRKKFL